MVFSLKCLKSLSEDHQISASIFLLVIYIISGLQKDVFFISFNYESLIKR